MSLFGSLFSAVSALNAQSQSMSMIADNISNVNTIGYKASTARFETLVTSSATDTTFTPGGVRARTLALVDQQGLVQASNSPTDLAIAGQGFFVVNSLADGSGSTLFTRAGSFRPDSLGNLTNSAGFYFQGWRLDVDGRLPGATGNTTNTTSAADLASLETVNVNSISGVAAGTTEVALGTNLTASQSVFGGTYAAGTSADNMASGNVSAHFSRAVRIFDAQGTGHDVQFSFLKTANNTWEVEIYASPAADVTTSGSLVDGQIAVGQIVFNGDGSLASISAGLTGGQAIAWTNGAIASSVTFDFGTAGVVGVGQTDGLSQFDGGFNVSFVNQNGSEVGELNGISIDEEGFVIATFTNGQTQKVFKVPVATFADVSRLESRNGNVFVQTEASGQFNLREAGIGGAGLVAPSALESANVDLGTEFTNMIITQRAFSASAKVITTVDDMLEELIRIKR